MLQSHRDPGRARQSPVVAPWSAGLYRGLTPGCTGVYRGRPGSTGTCREEILGMLKITGLCRGPPRWSSLSGSAVQAPCCGRDLPCLRRGYRIDARMYRISISATIPFLCRGVPCWLWTWSWTWSRQPSSCQTPSLLFFFSYFSLDFRRC